ncbi:MAG: 16S rRNA (cytosine(1402)-N(4))-methyltransferase RsmH [Nitrospinota bacterium]
MNSDSCDGTFSHKPVLLDEIVCALTPRRAGTYLDCTLGGGGHAAAIIEKEGNDVHLIGMDRDEVAVGICRKRLQPLGGQVELHCERFENMKTVLAGRMVDGIVMDLGVSSLVLDDPKRGFSFQADGPLDMRMDQSQPLTAAGIVNTWAAKDLADMFRKYGEERNAKRIAAAIVRKRAESPIETTLQLSGIVKSSSPSKGSRIHPATRVFMALRIAVNGELEGLDASIDAAVEHLVPGGRLAVISFHSLEDRIVKRAFARLTKGCVCPPKIPQCVCGKKPSVKPVSKKPVTPSNDEVRDNPRARSAKLRIVERLAA